jgi:hypothetical protein
MIQRRSTGVYSLCVRAGKEDRKAFTAKVQPEEPLSIDIIRKLAFFKLFSDSGITALDWAMTQTNPM